MVGNIASGLSSLLTLKTADKDVVAPQRKCLKGSENGCLGLPAVVHGAVYWPPAITFDSANQITRDLSPSSLDSFGFLNRRKGGFVPVCSPPSETTNFYFSEVDDTWEQRENILHPIAASFKPGLSLNCLCGGFEASLSAIFHHNLTASRQNGVII